MTKLSSRATRLMTIALPSIANSRPPIVASASEPVSLFATSMMSTTATMPASAVAIRQPTGLSGPKASIPRPMSHLPNGGCTTNEASARNPSTRPALNSTSASAGHEDS